MSIVWLTALGVGGATMVGAVLGFVFRRTAERFGGLLMSFASGVMLAAAVLGLILPALEQGGTYDTVVVVAGILTGALGLQLLRRLLPGMQRLAGIQAESGTQAERVLLFTAAIALHNLPEGLAAGVGFGTGSVADALMIAGGIALQNLPEGMVLIGPLQAAGVSPGRTLLIALATGAVEIVGTLLGYFAVQAASALLPFALAFAGGTMLYVISDEMIPEIHTEGGQGASFTLLLGFCLMLVIR